MFLVCQTSPHQSFIGLVDWILVCVVSPNANSVYVFGSFIVFFVSLTPSTFLDAKFLYDLARIVAFRKIAKEASIMKLRATSISSVENVSDS